MPRSSDLIECVFSYLPSHQAAEALVIDFLKQCGFNRHELVQTAEGKWQQIRVYLASVSMVARLQKAFRENPILKVFFSKKHLAYKAWAEKWKEDYQIQTLGKKFVIIPAWRKKEFRPKKFKRRIPVCIDPLSAFGSGEHETTRLITRLMEGLHERFQTFLDIGTGTGILAVLAAHCGAKEIVGFDNDKPSAECAQFNFKANQLENVPAHFFCAELARFKPEKKFDLVCANINSHILENYRRQIIGSAKKGGWVLVSGILHQTYNSFREAFDTKDLRALRVLRGRRWVAVLYKKL